MQPAWHAPHWAHQQPQPLHLLLPPLRLTQAWLLPAALRELQRPPLHPPLHLPAAQLLLLAPRGWQRSCWQQQECWLQC
jgi:hypothetical protein